MKVLSDAIAQQGDRPILGITMGDPAGGGPELCVKALRNPEIYRICRPVIVGDAKMIEDSLRILHDTVTKIHCVSSVHEALFEFGTIDVYHLDLVDMQRFRYGQVDPMCGEAAFQCVVKVIELAMSGQIDGTVTNALNKEAVNLAGHHYSGHTEIYADYTHTKKYTMLLASEDLRVVHVSTHVSLRQACDLVKKERVYDCIKIALSGCKQLGIMNPRIGVAGLNPHAGENGLFGTEEIEEIIPAIEQARSEGITVDGPLPPDTAFSKARGGWYDILVVMYHDQGHIPLKLLGFVYDRQAQKWGAVSGVNITLGLPIIRTSVDHGTAFDHAGEGTQNELSLINAIQYAVLLAQNRSDS
jgi:4-phospho-D-threonate 3-dehydrogenase / 4-phospho-D-erythronate 3-dehydrogenase